MRVLLMIRNAQRSTHPKLEVGRERVGVRGRSACPALQEPSLRDPDAIPEGKAAGTRSRAVQLSQLAGP